jgi:hypothetical protein
LPPQPVLTTTAPTGYRVRDTIARDREAVYAYDWLPRWTPVPVESGEPPRRVAPTPEEFEEAEHLYATLQAEHATG